MGSGAVSYFSGTVPGSAFRARNDGRRPIPTLIPYYEQIDQTVSIDIQATYGGWLLKFEGFSRSGQGPRFTAFAAGFEYTFTTIFGTGADLGVLSEYLYDERGKTFENPFDNDVFVGSRLALNNVSGTDLLAGVVIDADTRRTRCSRKARHESAMRSCSKSRRGPGGSRRVRPAVLVP